MLDFIKKSILAGVGASAATKERVEATLNEFVAKGRLTASEARQIADKLFAETKEEAQQTRKTFKDYFQQMLHEANVVTTSQIETLEKRIEKLEKKLDGSRSGSSSPSSSSTKKKSPKKSPKRQ